MNKEPSCVLNGHGFNNNGECIYCGEYKNAKDPWANAKWFHIFGYSIPVLKARDDEPRKFYTELHRDDAYLASMGSDMPTYLLAALETYFKRGKLLDDQL